MASGCPTVDGTLPGHWGFFLSQPGDIQIFVEYMKGGANAGAVILCDLLTSPTGHTLLVALVLLPTGATDTRSGPRPMQRDLRQAFPSLA